MYLSNELKYTTLIRFLTLVIHKAAISSRVCLLHLATINIANMQHIR